MKELDLESLIARAKQTDPTVNRQKMLDRINTFDQLQTMAHYYVTPIYLASNHIREGGVITDGASATFISRDTSLAILNHHVFDQYLKRLETNRSTQLYLGNLEINNVLERVVSKSIYHDLVTIRIKEEELTALNKVAPREVHWSKVGAQTKVLILAGYPQAFRSQDHTEVRQGGISFCEFAVENSSPHRIILSCDREQWTRGFGERDLTTVKNWGGLSGSGVFIFDAGQVLIPLRLAGTVTEMMRLDENSLTLAASPAELIDDAGNILNVV